MSKEQFFKELCTLRDLFGTKTFWASPAKVRLARKAIGIAYLATPTEEAVVTAFEATMSEFLRRAIMMGVDLITGEKEIAAA